MKTETSLAGLLIGSLREGNRRYKEGKKITRRVVIDVSRPKQMTAAQIKRLQK